MGPIGRNSKNASRTLLAAIICFSSTQSLSSAEIQSNDHRQVVAAFRCATLANVAGNVKEERRLFEVGLAAGRKSVGNHLAELKAKGKQPRFPSVDFGLGVFFALGQTEASFEMAEAANEPGAADQKRLAQVLFNKGNCALIK